MRHVLTLLNWTCANCAKKTYLPWWIESVLLHHVHIERTKSGGIHIIDASLTEPKVTFRAGNTSTFGVIVINRGDDFAAFELEVTAASGDRGSVWYRLVPMVSSRIPPGDRTKFMVEIFASPKANFAGDIKLTVRVFSPQLAKERRLVLTLTVEPDPLKVTLPIPRLKVYTDKPIEVAVKLQNQKLCPAEVSLGLKAISFNRWPFFGTAEKNLRLLAGEQIETSFKIFSSIDLVPSRDYQFKVVAKDREGNTAIAEGVIEVIPVGSVQFDVQPLRSQSLAKNGCLLDFLSNMTIKVFWLHFQNNSNVSQRIEIKIRKNSDRFCESRVTPETVELPSAEKTTAKLVTRTKRPWIGRSKYLEIEAGFTLSDLRVNIVPATQLLTLKVTPIIPMWLVVLLALLLVFLDIMF